MTVTTGSFAKLQSHHITNKPTPHIYRLDSFPTNSVSTEDRKYHIPCARSLLAYLGSSILVSTTKGTWLPCGKGCQSSHQRV